MPRRKKDSWKPPIMIVMRNASPATYQDLWDYESDDEYSDTTVLSTGSYEINSDDSSSSSSSSSSSYEWRRTWERLQRRSYRRDRMLDRLAQQKSPALMKVLRKREWQVRRKEYEELFWNHLLVDPEEHRVQFANDVATTTDGVADPATDGVADPAVEGIHATSLMEQNDQTSDEHDVDVEVWFDSISNFNPKDSPWINTLSQDCATSSGGLSLILERIYDFCILETYTTGPAIFALAVHCLLHAALFYGVESLTEQFKKYCETDLQMPTDNFALLVQGLLGLSILRLSGYLYWWMNNPDFFCVKFDFHNRARMGRWDAKFFLWMKQHRMLQCMLYFIGYQLCYTLMSEFFVDMLYYFDQRKEVTATLPNAHRIQGSQTLCAFQGFVGMYGDHLCTGSNNMTAHSHQASLVAEDILYVWRVTDYGMFLRYMHDWVDPSYKTEGDHLPLLTPDRAVAVSIAVVFLCIIILRRYGFGVFDKW